jgi:hypothetical protein
MSSEDQMSENVTYCERLNEKNITLNKNVVIIDGVHSGTGILALESALKHCFPSINVYKIAINSQKGISKIPVDEEIILPCEPKFSDTFPRLVIAFHPQNFKDSEKFITEFINIKDNPVAKMIIDIAKTYPEIPVEETDWYKLNNEITDEIAQKKAEKIQEEIRIQEEKIRIREEEIRLRETRSQEAKSQEAKSSEQGKRHFTPIVLTNPKRYKCPICETITGIAAPLDPRDTSLFSHRFDCSNKFKIPKE